MRRSIVAVHRRQPGRHRARLARGRAAQGGADRARARGRSTSRSASGRTPRSSPRRSRCRRSAPAPTSASIPSRSWNNPEPEIVLAVNSRGEIGRRDAGQRRQPARLRGPQRAAAGQGQGQQRVLRDRPVHPAVRRALRHRRRAPLRAVDARRRPRRLRAARARSSMAKISRDPLDLVGAGDRRATTSTPTASCCSSARCSRRRRTGTGRARASPTSSATSSRIVDAAPRHAGQPRRALRPRSRRGPSASAALMRNLAHRGLLH